MAEDLRFGAAVRRARESVGMKRLEVAERIGKVQLSIRRWEGGIVPSYEDRLSLLEIFGDAPRALLEELADAGGVPLAPLPPPPVVNAVPSALASPVPPTEAMDASAQGLVDDAVREAAEELDVLPRALRPVLSRLLDRMARAHVPVDAGARMVLGVPKRPDKTKEKPTAE